MVISARKVVIPSEGGGEEEYWFEIDLPAGKLEKLPTEEEQRVLSIFARAVGKEPKVEYIGMGQPPFERDLLIVLDESESIEKLKLDAKVLVSKAQVQDPHFNGFTYIKCRNPLASKRISSPQIQPAGSFQRTTSSGYSVLP